jgi:hypothetical protein
MVALAAGSSSRSTEISYQTKITTVMLAKRSLFLRLPPNGRLLDRPQRLSPGQMIRQV